MVNITQWHCLLKYKYSILSQEQVGVYNTLFTSAQDFYLIYKYKMEQIRKTKIARHSVDEKGRIYTCIETIVYDVYEIKNKNDIDFVVDKLKEGFY